MCLSQDDSVEFTTLCVHTILHGMTNHEQRASAVVCGLLSRDALGLRCCVVCRSADAASTIQLQHVPARARCVWSKSELARQTCSEQLDRGRKMDGR